jgi:drug/metabolite transporter (DMT)-like permease
MGILFGLLAACGWGIGDYLSRRASQAAGSYRVLFYVQAFLILFMALWLGGASWLGLAVGPPRGSWEAFAGAAALGALNFVGSLLLLRSFMIGSLTVVAPIASAFAAVSVALSLLWGDPIGPLKLLGLVVAIVGVALSSIPGPSESAEVAVAGTPVTLTLAEEAASPAQRARMLHRVSRALGVGVPEAIGAALILGTYFWAQRFIVPDLGAYWAAGVGAVGTWLIMFPVAWGGGPSVRLPAGRVLARVACMAVGYQIAAVAFNLGLGSDSPGVVAVIGSLASPITVLLAFVFLHERLTRLQWAGVGLIFVALVLIGWPG